MNGRYLTCLDSRLVLVTNRRYGPLWEPKVRCRVILEGYVKVGFRLSYSREKRHVSFRRTTQVASIFSFLAAQPIILVFLLVGLGMFFGHLKIKSVGLGAAAVLFIAIILSAWAKSYGVEMVIDAELGHFGLALFAFAIGVNSGASFFHNLKTALGPSCNCRSLHSCCRSGIRRRYLRVQHGYRPSCRYLRRCRN